MLIENLNKGITVLFRLYDATVLPKFKKNPKAYKATFGEQLNIIHEPDDNSKIPISFEEMDKYTYTTEIYSGPIR